MISWVVPSYVFCFIPDHILQKHTNNPCEAGNKDTWTFERFNPLMSKYEGIKKFTRYEVGSGCCRKLASTSKRNNLHSIMEMMRHSLGSPIPDNRLNQSALGFSVVWPTEDLIRQIERQ